MHRRSAIFLLLLLVYAGALGLRAAPGERYAPAEAHRLMTAASIGEDGSLDLRDEYASRTWERWDGPPLQPTARVTAGRLAEPQGIGFPLLIAPAYALGGPLAVELQCALLLALAFALALGPARRLVPEPWATRSVLLAGLSPPAIAASTTVAPVAVGALLLTGAAVLALRIRESPRMPWTIGAAALLGLTAWMDVHLAVPGAVIALALWRWLQRRQKGLAGFVAIEVVLTSAIVYVTVNDRVFGGPTPVSSRLSGGPATGAEGLGEYLERIPRLLGALAGGDAGLLRWAPVFALAGAALWVLWHSRRAGLAALVPDQVDVEVGGGLLAGVGAAGLAAAVFARPAVGGDWLVPPDLAVVLPCLGALGALALRRWPRAGSALAILTLTGSVWLLAGARLDAGAGVAPPRGDLPWGGVERVLPDAD